MENKINCDKATDAVDYILNANFNKILEECRNKGEMPPHPIPISIIKLINILFYADYLSFSSQKSSITQDTYLIGIWGAKPQYIYQGLICGIKDPLEYSFNSNNYTIEGSEFSRNDNFKPEEKFNHNNGRSDRYTVNLTEEDKKYLNKAIEECMNLNDEKILEKIRDLPPYKNSKVSNSVINFY